MLEAMCLLNLLSIEKGTRALVHFLAAAATASFFEMVFSSNFAISSLLNFKSPSKRSAVDEKELSALKKASKLSKFKQERIRKDS